MTLQETLMLMAKLSAFYGQGKSNPKQMAVAWHEVLQDYDFQIASNAVTEYAKNDVREYAMFPSVGAIVKAIDMEKRVCRRIYNEMFKGTPYKLLTGRAKDMIDQKTYEFGIDRGQEYLREHKERVMETIEQKYKDNSYKLTQEPIMLQEKK